MAQIRATLPRSVYGHCQTSKPIRVVICVGITIEIDPQHLTSLTGDVHRIGRFVRSRRVTSPGVRLSVKAGHS
jgi:hypothetical protein